MPADLEAEVRAAAQIDETGIAVTDRPLVAARLPRRAEGLLVLGIAAAVVVIRVLGAAGILKAVDLDRDLLAP